MKLFASCVLAAACLASSALRTILAAPCSGGLGETAYCAEADTAAHKVTKCPDICKKSKCKNNDPAEPERAGAYLNDADTMNWEEITRTGLYEHVYIEDDLLCISSCWYWPWAAKCERWQEAEGKEYCGHLNCEHDDVDSDDPIDGGNRYSGCHAATQDGVLQLKLDWHEPTCNQCIRLFPQACYDDLKSYAVDKDTVAAEYREEKLEEGIREFCYDSYFSHLFDESPDLSVSSSDGRRLLSEDDDDDSDDAADINDDDNTNESSEDISGLVGPSFKKQVEDWVEEEILWMAANGKIECPAAQCLTKDQELLTLYAEFPDPMPMAQIKAALSNPTLKWYHNIDGFCNWNNCETGPEGGAWCNDGVDSCMRCNGAWCPVKAAGIPLPPVTQQDYFPLPEPTSQDPWYLTTDDGYCSFNLCDGGADFGPWCNKNYGNCHMCYGLWCPPAEKAEEWDPISRDGASQELTVLGAPVLQAGESYRKLSSKPAELKGRRLKQAAKDALPAWMDVLSELADTSSCPVSMTDLSSEQVDNIPWFLSTKGKLVSATPDWEP